MNPASQRLRSREQEGAQGVCEVAGLRAERAPAGHGIELSAVGERQQGVEPCTLGVELGHGDIPHGEEVLEALRPRGVDREDDLGLLHEIVDELGGRLELPSRDRVLDLRHRRDSLVGGVAQPNALADLVGPREDRRRWRCAAGDRSRGGWTAVHGKRRDCRNRSQR